MTDNILKEALLLSHPHIITLFDLQRRLEPFSEQVSRAGRTEDSHLTLKFNVGSGQSIASIEYGTQIDKPGLAGTLTDSCPWLRVASVSFYLASNAPVLLAYRMSSESKDNSGIRAQYSRIATQGLPINKIKEVKTAMLAFMLAVMKPEDAARFATSWATQIKLDKHARQGAKKASSSLA